MTWRQILAWAQLTSARLRRERAARIADFAAAARDEGKQLAAMVKELADAGDL